MNKRLEFAQLGIVVVLSSFPRQNDRKIDNFFSRTHSATNYSQTNVNLRHSSVSVVIFISLFVVEFTQDYHRGYYYLLSCYHGMVGVGFAKIQGLDRNTCVMKYFSLVFSVSSVSDDLLEWRQLSVHRMRMLMVVFVLSVLQ